jgi:hypothetical protein
LIRRLIDPSVIEVLKLPRNEEQLVQQLSHHWCAFYDNITYIEDWISDALCTAVTGGGFSKRELYTDDDDIIYNYRRAIGLNGINVAARRPDLLDRTMLAELEAIDVTNRREERVLFEVFDMQKGLILGGFLDVLVKAHQFINSISIPALFRMADFTRWGAAIAVALGKTEEEFIEAYKQKVELQNEEALHVNTVASVLITFMESHNSWEGTPTELFKELQAVAQEVGVSTRAKAFPKAPNALTRTLNELVSALRMAGIIEIGRAHV